MRSKIMDHYHMAWFWFFIPARLGSIFLPRFFIKTAPVSHSPGWSTCLHCFGVDLASCQDSLFALMSVEAFLQIRSLITGHVSVSHPCWVVANLQKSITAWSSSAGKSDYHVRLMWLTDGGYCINSTCSKAQSAISSSSQQNTNNVRVKQNHYWDRSLSGPHER